MNSDPLNHEPDQYSEASIDDATEEWLDLEEIKRVGHKARANSDLNLAASKDAASKRWMATHKPSIDEYAAQVDEIACRYREHLSRRGVPVATQLESALRLLACSELECERLRDHAHRLNLLVYDLRSFVGSEWYQPGSAVESAALQAFSPLVAAAATRTLQAARKINAKRNADSGHVRHRQNKEAAFLFLAEQGSLSKQQSIEALVSRLPISPFTAKHYVEEWRARRRRT